MSVRLALPVAVRMHTALVQKEATLAPVQLDSLEMEPSVLVCLAMCLFNCNHRV